MLFKGKRIFFSGIGGSGVSALANFAVEKGASVSGSDRAFDMNPAHPLITPLKKKGISIVPQDGSGINAGFDHAVFSTAVEAGTPEVMRAQSISLPLYSRPQYLALLVREFKTLAVAGTSGKSTASGLLAFLMEGLGLCPNFIGGGRVKVFKREGNPGNSLTGDSEWLVVEACESDGSITEYRPLHTIILNLEMDHHSIDETAEMFKALVKGTAGMVLINADDANLSGLDFKHAVTFGIEKEAQYRATGILLHPFKSDFVVNGVEMALSIPGKYNIYNALSAISLLAEFFKISLKDIARVLPEFTGIERRFDIHLNGKRLVIDDYAHNPHKIASLMDAAANVKEGICYIFQPHGYGPTRMMKDEYIKTFARKLRPGDKLILLPIFYQGGTATKNIESEDLVRGIRELGKNAESVETREAVLARVGEYQNYVVLGARDETLSQFAAEIAARLR
jgi:UDP-N-acetylmuramate--alanine ligase